MSWPITYTQRYHYQSSLNGIEIPTTLEYGNQTTSLMAKVDTGAHYCLFKREIGERLGINVDAGDPIILDSLGGPVEAFGHEVALQTLNLTFYSLVYFAKYPHLRRNILGSVGWLRNVYLGVVDQDEMVYLAPYGEFTY